MKQLYNRYFPTPSYLAMNSFAVDISDQSIKYGELIATPHGLKLGRFGKEKIEEGSVVSGKIENEENIVSVLRLIKQRENLNFVRVSLPEEQMYLFTLSLPNIEGGNIRDMILLQIEEHIPLKAIDTVFEYEIFSRTPNNILVEVSAIAAGTLDGYLSVFKKAGLSVLSFELEAQAIARAVIPLEDTEPVMIVDFGDTRTGVSIVHDGRVFFTTTLDLGGVNLTNMISKNFDISKDKAEEMKRSYGLNEASNAEDIFPIILNGISVLRDELTKQYTYWKDHENYGIKHDKISRIILCGGDANLVGLSEYLEASMKIKVEHANAWVNISQMDISVPEMSFEESLAYATVLGLALGNYSYSIRPIMNVLPLHEKQNMKTEYWKRFIIIFVALSSFIALLATILLMPSYFFSFTKQNIIEQRLEEFNINNQNLVKRQDLDKTIIDINKKVDLLSIKPAKQFSVSEDILDTVLQAKPEGIKYNQILFNQRKDKSLYVEVYGVAKDRTLLKKLKSNIDSNSKVASSNLPISNFLEKTDVSFTISIVMK